VREEQTDIDVISNHSTNKQLVVLAGPHMTSETAIEEFFYSFARGDTPEFENERSLLGWSWPQILGLGTPHEAYDRFVTDFDDGTVRTSILDSLVRHIGSSSRGIIMGGDEYDRVGNTVWSEWDALSSVELARTTLDIVKEDVTIILLYQHPRVDQWLSLFIHDEDFWMDNLSSGTTKYTDDDYARFLCNVSTAEERWESLETAMNPFRIADIYLTEGYNVVMIDLQGVHDKGLTVEHVVGCDVLGGKCTLSPGWLDGLQNKTFEKFSQQNDQLNQPFSQLTVKDVQDLESLFRLRDCYYQRNVTSHPRFTILHETSILSESSSFCPTIDHDARHVPDELANTTILFSAIQSQKKCNRIPISLSTMLGHAPKVTLANMSQYTDPSKSSEEGAVDPTTMTTSTTTLAVIGAIVAMVGLMALLGVVRADRIKSGRYVQADKVDGVIMPHIFEDPNRPLNELL
jgi:hypothetical protein